MAKAEFYPHEVSTVEQRETHISKVFLTGKYAVKMRQLPEELSMLQLVRNGKLETDFIQELARVLAGFYQNAAGGENINKIGSRTTVWANNEEYFRQTEQFTG
jgi:aminoglycoside phosphotransferase family enzyme